jgi:O-antigen/teichoic acid export membrane protein
VSFFEQFFYMKFPYQLKHFKSIGLLVGSTIVGQLAVIVVSPFLTRIYAPADIGLLGLVSSIAGILSTVVTLKYELAIIGAETEDDSLVLVIISSLFTIIFTFLFSIIFVLISVSQVIKGIYLPLWVIPFIFITTVAYSLTYTFRYFLTKKSEFKLIANVNVWQGIGRAILQILGAPFGALGLVAGEAIGRGFGIPKIIMQIYKSQPTILQTLNLTAIKTTCMKYIAFPKYVLPSSFFDILAVMLPIPMITALFGLEAGGFLALAQRITSAPLTLVGASIADVFHTQTAKHKNEDPNEILNTFWSTFKLLAIIGIIPTIVLFLYGTKLFDIIFGSHWSLAGTLASIMAPWMFIQFLTSPLSRVILLSDKQYIKLIYDILKVILIVILPLLAIKTNQTLTTTISWLNIGNFIAYLIYFLIIFNITNQLAKQGK